MVSFNAMLMPVESAAESFAFRLEFSFDSRNYRLHHPVKLSCSGEGISNFAE